MPRRARNATGRHTPHRMNSAGRACRGVGIAHLLDRVQARSPLTATAQRSQPRDRRRPRHPDHRPGTDDVHIGRHSPQNADPAAVLRIDHLTPQPRVRSVPKTELPHARPRRPLLAHTAHPQPDGERPCTRPEGRTDHGRGTNPADAMTDSLAVTTDSAGPARPTVILDNVIASTHCAAHPCLWRSSSSPPLRLGIWCEVHRRPSRHPGELGMARYPAPCLCKLGWLHLDNRAQTSGNRPKYHGAARAATDDLTLPLPLPPGPGF